MEQELIEFFSLFCGQFYIKDDQLTMTLMRGLWQGEMYPWFYPHIFPEYK